MANYKVILGNEVLINLENDTVTADTLLSGQTAPNNKGVIIEGTCAYDADTSTADAGAAEILSGKTAYVRAAKVTGSMTNNGSVTGTISSKDGSYAVPQGYHDGGGTVSIADAEKAKLIADNIKQGVTILGVAGGLTGQEGVNAQSKTATPSLSEQTISPDSGYTHLTEVVINPIPVTRTNDALGTVVRIG